MIFINELKEEIRKFTDSYNAITDFISEEAYAEDYVFITEEIKRIEDYIRLKTNDMDDFDKYSCQINNCAPESLRVPIDITRNIVENAFMHGDVSAKDFLTVNFSNTNKTVEIECRCKNLPEGVADKSLKRGGKHGKGLDVLNKRVLLHKGSIDVAKDEVGFYITRISLPIVDADYER
ncbi:MAG: hypothetical protein HUK24_05010 [Sphaerochaetaceae bacterium]|nr:hypothetical protein [Sphaerochaetaceae bacterium]